MLFSLLFRSSRQFCGRFTGCTNSSPTRLIPFSRFHQHIGAVLQSRHCNMPSSENVTGFSQPSVELRFCRLSENAYEPTRGSEQAAGFDLRSAYEYTVPASGKALVLTDIQIALPDGCYGRVAPRSGLAVKHFIDTGAGVIDQDYRGNVGVVLFNFGKEDFKVAKGDRVAQLILERIYIPKLVEVKSLDSTSRGDGGFGSTGHN